MAHEDPRFSEFLVTLRSENAERSRELADSDEHDGALAFREDVFTAMVIDALEDLGQAPGAEICYFERTMGRGIGKVNAWYFDEENGQVDLYTSLYRGLVEPGNVTGTELAAAVRRAVHVFRQAGEGYHKRMEPAHSTYDMMERLHQAAPATDRLRIIVIADGLAGEIGRLDSTTDLPELQVDIWDLRRLFRAVASGLPYEPTEIDFVKRTGFPIACLTRPDGPADYECYLTILPGTLLHSIYHEFGPRLLELNVRSFLQARGKVNKGIRDTLKNEPERFLAYNNGISITAENVNLGESGNGAMGIRSITGFQVVNGGQTVASIHRAKERDKVDLSNVYVQAKISVVRPEQIETLVPLISRYANTQNRVNEADFSANHAYHVRIQQLAETTWTPGEQSRWFYERARGQYQVARAREGTTPARLHRFDATTPTSQRFDKVQLAKYVNAWDQLPHIVSRGSQKNFVSFMERLARTRAEGWEPDVAHFRDLIAKAILFKRAEKIARQHKFPSYRANAVAYSVALVSYRTAGRIKLEEIWNSQDVTKALADTVYDWMPEIHEQIIGSAGTRNVTEWCKKEECWRHIQMLDLEVPKILEDELAAGQALPTVGDWEERAGHGLTSEDRENIARVMQVSADEWIHICGWGARTGNLEKWQIGIATTLAAYAATAWNNVPSKRQAAQGVRIIAAADDEGGRLLATE